MMRSLRYVRWALTLEVVAMMTDGPLSVRLPTDGGDELRVEIPFSITDFIDLEAATTHVLSALSLGQANFEHVFVHVRHSSKLCDDAWSVRKRERRRHKDPWEVLARAHACGWSADGATVRYSRDQRHHGVRCAAFESDCSGHGENLLGACLCAPAWRGAQCAEPAEPAAAAAAAWNRTDRVTSDRAFYSEGAGVFAVSSDRWHAAQEAEAAFFQMETFDASDADADADADDDAARVGRPAAAAHGEAQIEAGFDGYRAVAADGASLGRVLEIGAGPWPLSAAMARARGFDADQIVLLEPAAFEYARRVPSTAYRAGALRGFEHRTVVVSGGEDALELLAPGAFDTLLLVNVLQHVQNAPRLLRACFNALAVGGVLVFYERWFDDDTPAAAMIPAAWNLDALFHPIRLKNAVVERFLNGFERLHETADRRFAEGDKFDLRQNGTYFIGRKRRPEALCAEAAGEPG